MALTGENLRKTLPWHAQKYISGGARSSFGASPALLLPSIDSSIDDRLLAFFLIGVNFSLEEFYVAAVFDAPFFAQLIFLFFSHPLAHNCVS